MIRASISFLAIAMGLFTVGCGGDDTATTDGGPGMDGNVTTDGGPGTDLGPGTDSGRERIPDRPT